MTTIIIGFAPPRCSCRWGSSLGAGIYGPPYLIWSASMWWFNGLGLRFILPGHQIGSVATKVSVISAIVTFVFIPPLNVNAISPSLPATEIQVIFSFFQA